MAGTIYLEDGPYGSYLVRHEDGRSFLVQTDWDFPGVARSFGWSGRYSRRNYGADPGGEITAARDWLDANVGIEAEDPGYFDEPEQAWELFEVSLADVGRTVSPGDLPMWQQMAIRRHENEAVLAAIERGATTRSEIAKATGMLEFRVELALRRLRAQNLIDYS